MDVTQVWNAVDDALFLGQECGCKNRKGGVFGTADAYIALERATAVNENLIHGLLR